MSGHDVCTKLSRALHELRSVLNKSTLPKSRLKELKSKLDEFEKLAAEAGEPKRKAGRRPEEKVPMSDMTIAMQYLHQPKWTLEGGFAKAVPQKSVAHFINVAIELGGFGGPRKAEDTTVIARRVRRLIKRIETSNAEELATE